MHNLSERSDSLPVVSADASQQEEGWEAFLMWLATESKIDIYAYKIEQICCRLTVRRQLSSCGDWHSYRQYLLTHPQARERLIESLTISVSSFFRDWQCWRDLESLILPSLGAGPLRAWSVGCAAGQELYSLAICLDRAGRLPESELLGTDCSSRAIEQARLASYRLEPPEEPVMERLVEYARFADGTFQLSERLRERVQFRCEDLFSYPFSGNWDLICCRNLLIYLNEGAQKRLLRRLCVTLRPGGVLFIGRSERIFEVEKLGLEKMAPYLYRRQPVQTRTRFLPHES